MYDRPSRVAEAIKEQLSMILEKDVADPRLELVTVTDVVVSSDLRHASVYYSVLGGAKRRKACAEALDKATGFLRAGVAHVLELKFTPELKFIPDTSAETGERIDRIIHRHGGPST